MHDFMRFEEMNLIAIELRQMARDNSDVPSMLRLASNRVTANDPGFRAAYISSCFTTAFHATVGECRPLLRWVGFGGRLDDAQVNELFTPIIKRWLLEAPI